MDQTVQGDYGPEEWAKDIAYLRILSALYAGITDQVALVLSRIREYDTRLVSVYHPARKPVRKVNPNDLRPFAICSGRAVVEAKKAGLSEAEADTMARERLDTLATNDHYKLLKAPQAAYDRISRQIREQYDDEA